MRFSYFLFANSRRFLAFAFAQVIQLRPTRFAYGLNLDLGDAGRVKRENALDSFAIGNSANGERFVQTAPFAADHDSGKNLHALLISLDHASMHPDAVADLEVRAVALLLLFFDEIDDPVHNQPAAWLAGRTLSIEQDQNANGRCRSCDL